MFSCRQQSKWWCVLHSTLCLCLGVCHTCKHYVIPSHDCHWNELVKPHFNAMLAVAIFFLVGTLKLYSIHIQMLWPLWLVYTIAMTKLNFTPFDWYTYSLSFFNKCMYVFCCSIQIHNGHSLGNRQLWPDLSRLHNRHWNAWARETHDCCLCC